MHPFPILAAFAAASLATSAQPQSPQRIVVSHADLDLTNRAGILKLDRRILIAVKAACGPTSDADPSGQNEARRCRKQAAAQVKPQRQRLIAAALLAAGTKLAVRR